MSSLNHKTILVTGSAGFIGANLVKRLLKDMTEGTLIGLDNLNNYYDVSLKEYRLKELDTYYSQLTNSQLTLNSKPSTLNYKFVHGDLADKDLVNNLFAENKFDIVVNLAAQAGVRYSIENPDAYIESNIIGFYNILEACRHSKDVIAGEDPQSPTAWIPNRQRDVEPILTQLRAIHPTVITVAMDSVGLAPKTHYKVMKTIAEAVRLWNEEEDLSKLRIFGYRNVWSTYHPAEANVYVPVSLNTMAVFEKAFKDSYLTQVKAEFPNPDFDGPFSELAEQIWAKQYKDIQLILGKDFFYENAHPLVRATHGLLFLKEMTVKEFITFAEEMKEKVK